MATFKLETHTYLRYDGQLGAKIPQPYISNVDIIDGDIACGSLQDPEQSQGQGRLPSSGTTDYTNLENKESRHGFI